MHDNRRPMEWIASHTEPGAVPPDAVLALSQLGYLLRPQDENCEDLAGQARPRLHLVDDRRLDSLPEAPEDCNTPIILLTGVRQRPSPDARVAGQLTRPADLHELYPLLQHALAREPRRAPRIETRLPARWLRRDGSGHTQILSLSTGGCRVRSSESARPGRMATLQISIPGEGLVHCRARCVWSNDSDTGFEFVETNSVSSHIIQRYVTGKLVEDRRPASG